MPKELICIYKAGVLPQPFRELAAWLCRRTLWRRL